MRTKISNLKLQSPWVTFYNYITAMFEGDSEVEVGELYEDGGKYIAPVTVNNKKKFAALKEILIQTYHFGNVVFSIDLLDGTDKKGATENNYLDLCKAAFKGNNIVGKIIEEETPFGTPVGFVCFQPDVIQFYNDDISDYMGNFNGLAEDIARRLFNVNAGVNFCTMDKRED